MSEGASGVKRIYGRPAKPLHHKDYLLEVPVYRYIRPCGHDIYYREPVPWGEWGWCATCREPWQCDGETWVVEPMFNARGKRPKKVGDELPILIDRAVIRNRVADLLWQTGMEEISDANARDFAKTVGCNRLTVYRVAEDMGIGISLE